MSSRVVQETGSRLINFIRNECQSLAESGTRKFDGSDE